MKYSINSNGFIVAERDIYSLGGFIPKGTVGGKIASEAQLSQDGDCWLAGGDISGRPDIVIKDNAYVGNFVGATGMHTDGVTEFSGNTLIPGKIIVRNPIADPISNFYAKDSFIGVSMDVLCGPEANTTAFPFGQGLYSVNSAKGTLFANMVATPTPVNSCRGIAALRLGKDTKIYVPVGLRCQVLWGYYNMAGQEAYSGRYTEYAPGLHTISDLVHSIARLHFWRNDGAAMTPANLLATGAKILGHISSSANVDIRPESASGQYVMDKSSFLLNTDNFGLATTQLRFLAGGMYDTTMYTKTDRQEYKPYGTFRNVARLEYTKYLGDSHRTAATRDTYISAYDCPLLRVDDDTYDTSLMGTGDLVLRRCIVPKGRFVADPINGNTYDDLDFSYANEDLGFYLPGYAVFTSSHRKGMYRVKAGTYTLGFVSHKGNLADTARLLRASVYLPLDGSIMEQGAYGGGTQIPYESAKSDSPIRIRTGKPLATFGLVFPSLPAGYSVKALYYMDDDFIIRSTATDPTEIVTTYPYVVMLFRKDDDSAINVMDFIALNRTLEILDYSKVPEITGSAYVGAGCTVRGDVQLHGDPYVNRVFDVNMWERGSCLPTRYLIGGDYESGKAAGTGEGIRFRFVDSLPVEPGDIISCAEGYFIYAYWYDGFGLYSSESNWSMTFTVTGNNRFLGIVLKKGTAASDAGGLITEEDLAIANVKYVRAFKKRRYIVNELDRTSPEDILLDEDMWERGYLDRIDGKTYEELKSSSDLFVRLKRPINTGRGAESSFGAGHDRKDVSFDAVTKCISADSTIVDGTPLYGTTIYKVPSAAISVSDVANSRFKVEFTPSPRIIAPYGSATLNINGVTIRMYDNAVLSRNLNQEGEIVLRGDAVMGYDFNSGSCMCSNGHHDAIIKLP